MAKDSSGQCGCFHHKMNGILIALIGLDFLLGAFDVFTPKTVGIAWPILIILIGLQNSLGKGMCKCCDKD